MPFFLIYLRSTESSHNGIAAVLKTAGRKPVGVRVPRSPQTIHSTRGCLPLVFFNTRRGARVVELATLERWYTGNGIVGSNPTFSASNFSDYLVCSQIHS